MFYLPDTNTKLATSSLAFADMNHNAIDNDPLNPVTSLKPCSLKRKRPPTIEIPITLREIQVNRLDSRDLAAQITTTSVGGDGFGMSSVKGKKKFMEDTHKILSCLPGTAFKVTDLCILLICHNISSSISS